MTLKVLKFPLTLLSPKLSPKGHGPEYSPQPWTVVVKIRYFLPMSVMWKIAALRINGVEVSEP